jgi:hypothetical protein
MSAPSNFSLESAQRPSQELKCSGSVYERSKEKCRLAETVHWGRHDLNPFTFTLTLLLLSTIGAAQTDNPMFWLLIGPASFAVVFTGLVFLPQGFIPRRKGNPLAHSKP